MNFTLKLGEEYILKICVIIQF